MTPRPLVCLVALSLAGCGGPSLAPVTGTVKIDGKALPGARIQFAPVAQNGITAGVGSYAQTDAQGHYSLKTIDRDTSGALIGKHRVVISISIGDPNSDSGAVTADKVPPWYNSFTLLEEDVKPGTNVIDFALSSQFTREIRDQLQAKYQDQFAASTDRWLQLKRRGRLD